MFSYIGPDDIIFIGDINSDDSSNNENYVSMINGDLTIGPDNVKAIVYYTKYNDQDGFLGTLVFNHLEMGELSIHVKGRK